ncbi:sporulation protein YqfD [Clostridium fallax]|uniref:Similar to stage IV sporulation protein n=1 Tax=Clostridium fallax TaxID=1533 RepID=A0A1M4YNY7_9CLOT|nr:sporulation protein YqfD [Clostridium fallax]SHF07373.1 similar to stage IV sporulation protein [Clostridium fallax]SQB07535.1 stage IV sporulation protein [Clostridium fallax]
MILNRLKKGNIKIQIRTLKPEGFINLLWNNGVNVKKAKRLDISTMILEIDISDYQKVKELSKRIGCKIEVIEKKGPITYIFKLKKEKGLIIGVIVFVLIIVILNRFLWGIEIETERYLSPFEVRQQLKELGVTPGISKSKIDVYEVEKKLENINSEIMWIRARLEGATLKVKIEEKVNPPEIIKNQSADNIVAKMDGEVVRVYTTSGTAMVKPGDVIKKGQILIEGIEGNVGGFTEGGEYHTNAEGVVIANTFYESSKDLQIEGEIMDFTGNEDEEIYIEVAGKKFYIKKPTKKFKDYDKIEKKGKILNKIVYKEKINKPIEKSKDEIIEEATNKLYKEIVKNLDSEAKFIKKIINTEELEKGKIRLKVVFVFEQDISLRATSQQ